MFYCSAAAASRYMKNNASEVPKNVKRVAQSKVVLSVASIFLGSV